MTRCWTGWRQLVSSDEYTTIRMAAQSHCHHLQEGPDWNELAKRLLDLLANDREEVCEQVANALAELGPAGKDAVGAAGSMLWKPCGRDWVLQTHQPTVSNSIARAILMIESNAIDDKS